jgi:HK97 family phage major capsid protein
MNLKLLEERRAEIVCKMEDMVKNIETEACSFNEDEEKKFDDSRKEVEKIDSTIKKTEEFRNMNLIKRDQLEENQAVSIEKSDVKAFVDYIRNPVQNANFDVGSNGALIPVTISKQIIEAIQNICPIYNLAQVFNVKGELRIPYYGDNAGDNITCGYAQEFTELTGSCRQIYGNDS